jgi:hypothetical protein
MKNVFVAITFALLAGLGVFALNNGNILTLNLTS